MSIPKTSFIAELDQWSSKSVIDPLYEVLTTPSAIDVVDEARDWVKKANRAKVLEGHRNGQAAGPPKPLKR